MGSERAGPYLEAGREDGGWHLEGGSQRISVPQPLGYLGPLPMLPARFCLLPGVARWDGRQRRGPGPGHRAPSL